MIASRTVVLVLLLANLAARSVLSQAAEQPQQTPLLPPLSAWDGRSQELIADPDNPWITPAERSGLTTTPNYADTMAWLQRLVNASPRLQRVSIGRSDEGREIWMIIASADGAATADALLANGKPIVLAHSGIHSGEIDGKDAGLMLLRDMTVGDAKRDLLDLVNFLFIPILSVDGHERRGPHNRINQRGPLETGWRSNRRNLNLNRDFAKLETPEVRALVQTINLWQPDLYIDLHVTDGQDYQYDITFGYNGPHAWSPNIARWLDRALTPALNLDLEDNGHIPGPLIFAVNETDMSDGIYEWTAGPRYSIGWADARQLPAFLVENHSLKPYKQRVLGTYVLLESALRVVGRDINALRAAVRADRQRSIETVTLDWIANSSREPEIIAFRGIRSETYLSSISGAPTVRWTGEAEVGEVALVVMDEATATARRPSNYYIPAAWARIAKILARQGISTQKIETVTTIQVEMYRLPDAALDVEASPFEGRMLFTSGQPQSHIRELTLQPGSYRVSSNQALGTLLVLLLEPQSPDSLFQWGYFGEIMQATEYVEAYVMEPMARAMLAADQNLKAEFEHKLLVDSEFAGDPEARVSIPRPSRGL